MNHEVLNVPHFDPAVLVVSASMALRKTAVKMDQEIFNRVENSPEISESTDEAEEES